MSSNGPTSDTHDALAKAVADVSFAPVGSSYAESSSQASARSSVGKSSSTVGDKLLGKERREAPADRRSISPPAASNGHRIRLSKSGGFLLDPVFANGHVREIEPSGRSQGKRSTQPNGRVHVDKMRHPDGRASLESSQRSSPLTREVSVDGANDAEPRTRYSPRPSSIDPAQLVQMALNLSESRKRQASNSLQVPASPVASRRIASGLESAYGTVRATPERTPRTNGLRESVSRGTSESQRSGQEDAKSDGDTPEDNILYTFSPATLSRAERARRYFELASEHRRLLEHLPPLKPDTSAPENYNLLTTSSPGSAHFNMSRVPTNAGRMQQLGRPYNPLQALRNRKLRSRERRQFCTPLESFQETDRVRNWIDHVADASKEPAFRPGEDQVRLPSVSDEQDADGCMRPETAKGHRRTDTAGSVITRPGNGWTVEPAELFADTYWVETNGNKTIIEDRRGHRIFPPRSRPSVDHRRSVDSSRLDDAEVARRSTQGDSDIEETAKRRRRDVFHVPGRLRRHRVPILTRSGSVTSNSSAEGRNPPVPQFGSIEGGDENIGPLERHMREMIAKDERGELSSPEFASPDHWDSHNTPFSSGRPSIDSPVPLRDTLRNANGRLSVDTQRHKRSKSADGSVTKNGPGWSSLDELASDYPASPSLAERMTAKGMDFSTASGKRGSPDNNVKPRSHRLTLFRSRSKDRNRIEQTDFASNVGATLSPVYSAGSADVQQRRRSMDSQRPREVQRQRTDDSVAASLHRSNGTATAADVDFKETSTSGGLRFLKGSRIGEIMRNESYRFGDRFRGGRVGDVFDTSRAASEASDGEEDSPLHPSAGSRDVDSDISPRASLDRGRTKPKYYTSNLPSFTSATRDARGTATDGDPVGRQQDERRKAGRSPRFERLAPPRISLPEGDAMSDPDKSPETSPRYLNVDDAYLSKSTSKTSLASMSGPAAIRRHVGNGPGPPGTTGPNAKRHWSISDNSRPERQNRNKVTNRDIARVRALLLASGIKAHEILHQADTVRQPSSVLAIKAAETAGQTLRSDMPRKEEHTVVAEMLSRALTASLADFEKSLAGFQDSAAKPLTHNLETLQQRAADQLTKLVYEMSDEADAFNVELTTRQPQEVKRVDDAVDAMYRQRRRQFRLVRRLGFKLLEWLVLVVLWWVWFVVVMINTARKAVLGLLALVRWLFWF